MALTTGISVISRLDTLMCEVLHKIHATNCPALYVAEIYVQKLCQLPAKSGEV